MLKILLAQSGYCIMHIQLIKIAMELTRKPQTCKQRYAVIFMRMHKFNLSTAALYTHLCLHKGVYKRHHTTHKSMPIH
jgi:hypothetical protein